ncbi:MAG: hypothetical protein ABIT71_09405 [Vicinamibacteraceae bacterium]
MTEDDLRALVRQAVARHLGAGSESATGGASPAPPAPGVHPSFGRYLLPREPGSDGACLIEPTVKCNHCGFCQSHGF